MIIQEKQDELVCIEQHEHAMISGQFINYWRDDLFTGSDIKTVVEYAVTNHDRSWQPLDRNLVYLEEQNSIASFINYPLKKKIKAYEQGIEQLLRENVYAAYLISLHYASFFKEKEDADGNRFMKKEAERQAKLKKENKLQFKDVTEEKEAFHFNLLQLCDNLSLYLCMNEWGTSKEREVAWFRNGFPQKLEPLNNDMFHACWKSDTEVSLMPYPFQTERVHISIPYKRVNRKDLKKSDPKQLYKNLPYDYHPVFIVPEGR